ncbi:MAG: geranylgeranyl reductase family protein [Myxococcales bacterium]|nr:geranylgeranyl reductase family protein [Myxococcales bacterium]
MYDVAIIGAGPGGAAAAVALGQRGITNVVLLDREGFPRDKTCGSGLSPNALKMVETLGIGAEVKSLGVPINSVRIVTQGGREMIVASDAAAMVLLRRHFDHLLVKRAQDLGITLKTPFRAVELIKEADRVVGVTGFDGETVRARYVLCADGAHSIFSPDPRPKRSISTLMGWWDDVDVEPGRLDMVFDKNLSPLYGWLFPEGQGRVNIGICIDGQDASGEKSKRNLRATFRQFLDDHYAKALAGATQVGAFKGHPIVYTTWVGEISVPGALYLGEAARLTHNATGEGISQAMESGTFAAEAVARVLRGSHDEAAAWSWYLMQHRKRFTGAFVAGHALRAAVASPVLDRMADAYNNPMVRKLVVKLLGSALAGSSVSDTSPGSDSAEPPTSQPSSRSSRR